MTETKVNQPITVGDTTIPPGRKVQVELPFAMLVSGATESMPVKVINGRSAGPVVWLSSAIHGDELNGLQVIRRVISQVDAKMLRGAIIATPIVNPLGFMIESRYTPDRRDLNRSFPGSARGSTAARIAHLFMSQVVEHCSVGIDLHTATNHRINIPQVRANLDDAGTLKLARAFGAPFSIHAKLRDGSLRQAAAERDKLVLLYEAGQAHRFDDDAIEAGMVGVLRALRSLRMIDVRLPRATRTRLIRRTRWIRARRGGIVDFEAGLGDYVESGQVVASISDVFGARPSRVKSSETGWVIARSLKPIVNSGDALVHIACESGPDRDDRAEH